MALGQTARLNGFVTDELSGRPLEFVNIVIEGRDGEVMGTVTDRDGLYQIVRITPGRYVLRASFIGYAPFSDTLRLDEGEVRTANIELAPSTTTLDEVFVQAERDEGAARVTAGQQTIRPREVELIPAPDVAGDLASYLTTLPGVVATGDRGGQIFIRGGEPSQNLVLLDGMLVYQPFHLLGFYSAFPSSVLSRADIYAGGFGSRFGERLSSVLDVWSRDGNKLRYAAEASLSPFIATAQVEGPVVPGSVSVLASVRQSVIEEGAEPLLGETLPFRFGDAFGKVHAELGARTRLSGTILTTHDRGLLSEGSALAPGEEIRWANRAFGLRLLTLPRIFSVSADLRLSHSSLTSEVGPRDDPTRSTDIESTQLALDATFPGDRFRAEAGWSIRLISTQSVLSGLFQNAEARGEAIDHMAFYFEPEFSLGALRVRPGARLEFYNLLPEPVVEPRLRVVWAPGTHQLSGALGIYHQEILGLVDQRDAASVFTAWMNVPKDGPQTDLDIRGLPTALHALLGYRITPAPWFELSVEGFYKDLNNLFVSEWTPYPRMTTRLQRATGRSAGFDTRVEVRRAPVYGYVTYGYSSTRYTAQQATLPLWFGEDALTYRPAHDRRHQVNALLSVGVAGFDLSVRWAFGSGLPFSRPAGFDGFIPVDDVDLGPEAPRWRRAIYGRPFNAELPTYHRLDASVERTFRLGPTRLSVLASVINVYDRRNIFFVDVFTLERRDQLPIIPSLGLKIAFGETP